MGTKQRSILKFTFPFISLFEIIHSFIFHSFLSAFPSCPNLTPFIHVRHTLHCLSHLLQRNKLCKIVLEGKWEERKKNILKKGPQSILFRDKCGSYVICLTREKWNYELHLFHLIVAVRCFQMHTSKCFVVYIITHPKVKYRL